MVKDREVREPSSISPGPKGGKLQSSKVVPGSSCTNEVGQQLAHQKICNYRIQQLSQTLENADFPLPCGPEGFFFWLPLRAYFPLKQASYVLSFGERAAVKISAMGRILQILFCYMLLHAAFR